MRVYNREDIMNNCDLKEFQEKESKFVVKFPAIMMVAECGCWIIDVVTPFGRVQTASHRCEDHLGEEYKKTSEFSPTEYAKKYRQEHKEEYLAYQKKYYQRKKNK